MKTWAMFAGLRNGIFRHTSVTDRYPRLSGNHDVRPVTVTEDPEGTYYGWIPTGEDAPIRIWHTRALFIVGFSDDPATLEKTGRGRTVRLTIEEAS